MIFSKNFKTYYSLQREQTTTWNVRFSESTRENLKKKSQLQIRNPGENSDFFLYIIIMF